MSAKNLGARKKREKSRSAKNQGALEHESANAKARNLRPKKERESASAKRKKKRVPSSANYKDDPDQREMKTSAEALCQISRPATAAMCVRTISQLDRDLSF
jgi:hypothetical protein